MKKIITYGHHTAELYAGEHRAQLITDEERLPTTLADMLDQADDIHVHGLGKIYSGAVCITMIHDCSPGDLLAEVCDAITSMYETEVSVSNARPNFL